MEEWKSLEIHYARRLREANSFERINLYNEAYSTVSNLRIKELKTNDPEARTAGTSKQLVQLLSQLLDEHDDVIEIGCGRGYTCLMLAPYVRSMVGTEVSESSINESKQVLSHRKIKNVDIKQVSASELIDSFGETEFNVCISIDVVEHLHPDDAEEHFKQVFHILRPGGKYIVITPNRLNGPHDITKEVFPEARDALGFHLNESTYREMTAIMKAAGFNKFRVLYPLKLFSKNKKALVFPYQFSIIAEILYGMLPNLFRHNILEKMIFINLIAYKPITI